MRKLITAIMKTGVSSMANMLFNMASVKIIALVLGPAGVGLFSLLKQAILTLAAVGLGGQTALVQGVSSRDGIERSTYIRTVFWLFFWGSLATVILIGAFAPAIASMIFGKDQEEFVTLVRWIALPVFLSNAYFFTKSLLNGFRFIGTLALVEIFGPFAMLLLIYPVCTLVGEDNSLAFVWLFSAAQATMLLVSLGFILKNSWLPSLFAVGQPKIDKLSSKYFFNFAGTTLLTSLLGTGSILLVRSIIIRHGGLGEAGLFDLAWSLSGNYVMLLLTAFGTYYMPALSRQAAREERVTLICQVIRVSTLLMVPLIVSVVVLKPMIVSFLYTAEFMPSLEIVRWMLVGDYFKVTGWVLAIPALANADMKVYFWSETFWYVGFALLSALSVLGFGSLQGVAVSFGVLYLCYVVYYLEYVRVKYGLRLNQELLLPWLIGLAVVSASSMLTWDDMFVQLNKSVPLILASICYVFFMLNKTERTYLLRKIKNSSAG